MSTFETVSSGLDMMFDRPEGLYGSLDDVPLISQFGHHRRAEILDKLEIGDVAKMTCVDFGMGSWGFAGIYPRLHDCASAIGMDISRRAINMSRELVASSRPSYADRFSAYQSDGMQIPLPDSSVDLFFSGESIEHVKFPPIFLNEIHRVLRPGGQLVLTTPNRDAVVFKVLGEEYCSSPEHFWLFNYPELAEMVSEYFSIEESYGFNGSFGPEMDRGMVDPVAAERWAHSFLDQPDMGSGIIMRLRKKPEVTVQYRITDIPPESMAISEPRNYLDLEFGLKGQLMDPAGSVAFTRPPSNGLVCRFWSHRWSGEADVNHNGEMSGADLYSRDPGWRNWLDDTTTSVPVPVKITVSGRRNNLSLNDQVIFYEAFTWNRWDQGERG